MKQPGNTYAHKVFLVATADSTEGLPPTIRRCFSHEITMGPLTEEQRVEMLSQSLKSISDLLPNVRNYILTSVAICSSCWNLCLGNVNALSLRSNL